MLKNFILSFVFLFFISISSSAYGQNLFKSFFKLSCPEKCWVISHPFSAKKVFRISLEASRLADSLSKENFLDGDPDGGQIDALRHAYWMARLTQQISHKSAISLGKKHEKGNYNDFKKKKNIPVFTHDRAACEMDLYNNEVGAKIGKQNPEISKDNLLTIIVEEILQGKLLIIKKDLNGNSLDLDDNIIPNDSIINIWNTPRILVPSSHERK